MRNCIVLIVICLISLSLSGDEDTARSLLLGWTGDGKTYFCNHYDGTVCEKHQYRDEYSTTTIAYYGANFIDTVGFGDNSGHETNLDKLLGNNSRDKSSSNQETKFRGSLYAIACTLIAVNNTKLRSLIWVVPCAERNTKEEGVEIMKFMLEMLGNIPIVAVFNPAFSENKCVKRPDSFKSFCAEKGLKIDDIIEIDKFNLEYHRKKYTKDYMVILPNNLMAILAERNPLYLKSKITEYRANQCMALPSLIALNSEYVAKKEKQLLNLSSPSDCSHIQIPNFESCDREKCTSWGEDCDGFWIFEDCDWVCIGKTIYQDTSCLEGNAAKQSGYETDLEICKNTIDQREKERMNRVNVINEEISNLKGILGQLHAKLATCNEFIK